MIWLMLLPSGRCYSHYRVVWVGRCYCQWQMVLPKGSFYFIFYFNLSSEMLARTSSHTCGRWYLPTFLFRDGSLTLMYIASLIALIWFKSSLPTILKLLMETLWPLMLLWSYMGEGGSDVPWTFPQMFLRILQCILHHSPPCHSDICIWPHFVLAWDPYPLEPSGGSWW